jgi:hypothetical protein
MNNGFKLLALSLCLLALPLRAGSNYEKGREDFKEALFERQQGLMDHVKYADFIENPLKEAEKASPLLPFCFKHSDNEKCQNLLYALLDYNVAQFHSRMRLVDLANFAAGSATSARRLRVYSNEMLTAIQELKTEKELSHIDPQAELEKAQEVVAKTNDAYIKQVFGLQRFLLAKNSWF